MDRNGFATAALLILLPLVLTAIAVIASGLLVSYAADGVTHRCRQELLGTATRMAASVEALFLLNHEAEALRLRRKMAEAEVAATIGTPLLMKAQANLALVIQAQVALARRQSILLTLARAEGASGSTRALLAARSNFESLRRFLNLRAGQASSWRPEASTVPLVVKPLGSLTPDYLAPPDFQTSTEMSLSWSIPLSTLLPEWLSHLASVGDLKLKSTCTARLEKEKQRWIAKLKPGKP